MPGRKRVSEKRRKDAGANAIDHIQGDMILDYMDEQHPMAMLKSDKAILDHIEKNQSTFKEGVSLDVKVALKKLSAKFLRIAENVPDVRLADSIHTGVRIVQLLDGEPSQRIEVKKTDQTSEEFNKVLADLKAMKDKESETIEIDADS